jgi:hypothetical protein
MTMPEPSRKKTEYSFLTLEVNSFDVRIGSAINHKLRTRKACSPSIKVQEHHTVLDLTCNNIDPDNPLSDSYSFTIYGDAHPYPRLESTLEDCHEEDEEGFKKYRKQKGVEIPVYDIPKGLAVLSKLRGERHWSTALWLPRDIVSDMLVLLSGSKKVYAFVHLKHMDRDLWILGFDLQTSNPMD